MLLCFEQIDEVLDYTYESDLFKLIDELKPDLRFLGDDYKNKSYTGIELGTKIHWISRNHGWSTTKFKKLISESVLQTN
jgi:glycerol-3-phosphate cytidylyltransferase